MDPVSGIRTKRDSDDDDSDGMGENGCVARTGCKRAKIGLKKRVGV